MKTDTIAAVSTAMSNNAGISIIRISGSMAFNIIDQIYRSKNHKKMLSDKKSHTIHYGFIYDDDNVIDEVMVSIMRAPHTYTKEDVIEINCHGGIIVTNRILETVIKYGARPAEPGEFTKRAFINGRIDLSQAEAVIDIITAKNEYALNSSIQQLKGNIKARIKEIRSNIITDVAFIEAALDDPEHISVDGFTDTLIINVNNNIDCLNKLLLSSENGRIIKEGINTVIIGKPNAGKSSLLNTLMGEERAIVTDIAGTTRDTLEESIQISGINLNIIDTAGIRKTNDVIERIGVEKAKKSLEKAELIIYVVDASKDLDENDQEIIDLIQNKKVIILLNKSDLEMKIQKDHLIEIINKEVIQISAKENYGVEEFETWLKDSFLSGELRFNDEIYITNIRHKTAIKEAIHSLMQVMNSIDMSMPEDFYSIDLMNAYEVLGSIIGESVEEDLVNTIFSKFCMGK